MNNSHSNKLIHQVEVHLLNQAQTETKIMQTACFVNRVSLLSVEIARLNPTKQLPRPAVIENFD